MGIAARCVPALCGNKPNDLAASTASHRLNFLAARLDGTEIALESRRSGEYQFKPAEEQVGDMLAGSGWDALLAEFRALGGTAENVILRQGPHGRGLFSLNPSDPVRLVCLPISWSGLKIPRSGMAGSSSGRPRLSDRANARSSTIISSIFPGAPVCLTICGRRSSNGVRVPQRFSAQLREIQPVSAARFSKPSEDLCHQRYIRTGLSCIAGLAFSCRL